MHHQKSLTYSAIVALLAVGVVACNDPTNAAHTALASTSTLADKGGNGSSGVIGGIAPTGTHFDLSVDGVPQGQTPVMTGLDGHTIFVGLFAGDSSSSIKGNNGNGIGREEKIFIVPAPTGASFQVLDPNATDANGATVQLPVSVSSTYNVWVRAVAPIGQSILSTCATAAVTDSTGVSSSEVVCPVATISMTRNPNAKLENVGSDLLKISVDASANPTLAACLGIKNQQQTTVGLFNSCFQNMLWTLQASGLAQVQLQFYPKAS
ncbi:MAG TPA: hypothetical protein VEV39_14415 [Gemmatimonadales bacterium]|nr:hypothetical protein [Gemmatimonadales bacterium]